MAFRLLRVLVSADADADADDDADVVVGVGVADKEFTLICGMEIVKRKRNVL